MRAVKEEMTVAEATSIYRAAFILQRTAEKEAEDLRPKLPTSHKKFHNMIQRACELSVKTNIARRQMVDLMEGSWS